jgi:hypothetical protein
MALLSLSSMTTADTLAQEWRQQLQVSCANCSEVIQHSIVAWLIGETPQRLNELSAEQVVIAEQAMDYRFRILQQRYLNLGPERAYRNLIQRLSSIVVVRNKIRTWIALSRDRQRTVIDVLQEVIQEMLQSDRYMQQQMAWIAQCTTDHKLRNALVLAAVEEYCLRPVRNKPLITFRFVNYLRRSQRGGMTQVPTDEFIRLVSEEILLDEDDSSASLLDAQAITQYQDAQAWEERQTLRQAVKQEFCNYLDEQVDPLATQWFVLYLQGHTQEMIAQSLNIPIKQVYRLREKVSYHAIRVFASKNQPELVATWLETSLKEHSLGLTPQQWQQFVDSITPTQVRIIEQLKAGIAVEQIAQELKLKPDQVLGEWSKLYVTAQTIRSSA